MMKMKMNRRILAFALLILLVVGFIVYRFVSGSSENRDTILTWNTYIGGNREIDPQYTRYKTYVEAGRVDGQTTTRPNLSNVDQYGAVFDDNWRHKHVGNCRCPTWSHASGSQGMLLRPGTMSTSNRDFCEPLDASPGWVYADQENSSWDEHCEDSQPGCHTTTVGLMGWTKKLYGYEQNNDQTGEGRIVGGPYLDNCYVGPPCADC